MLLINNLLAFLPINPPVYCMYTTSLAAQVGPRTASRCPSVLERCLDLRFREVEDLLGIPTENAVCDWVIFSVCCLGKEKESRSLKVTSYHCSSKLQDMVFEQQGCWTRRL